MSAFWTTLIVLVVIAVVVIVVLARLYRKASREVSLIRTGVGGQQVVMAGGTNRASLFPSGLRSEHAHPAARSASRWRGQS